MSPFVCFAVACTIANLVTYGAALSGGDLFTSHFVGDDNGNLAITSANNSSVLINGIDIMAVVGLVEEQQRIIQRQQKQIDQLTTTTTTTCQKSKTFNESNGHKGVVHSVAMDSSIIVSGAWDNAIKVWDRNNAYKLLKSLTGRASGHTNTVTSVALDANIIVSGSYDNTIKVWDRKNNYDLIKTLTGHANYVYSVALDANIIVSGSWDATIKVWDRENNYDLMKTLTEHTDYV
eukprot:UC1_evm1s311